MCQQGLAVHFCTCEDVKSSDARILDAQKAFQNGEYEEKHFIWTLKISEACEPYFRIGMIVESQNTLGGELTEEYFLKILNEKQPFDFEYTPQEKDEFEISEEYKFEKIDGQDREWFQNTIEFIYSNNKWQLNLNEFDYLSNFGDREDRAETFKSGIMEIKKGSK